jgi:hypothetical protein
MSRSDMTMLVDVDEMVVDDKEELKFYFKLSPLLQTIASCRLVFSHAAQVTGDSQNFSEEEEEDDTPRYASRREIHYFRSHNH